MSTRPFERLPTIRGKLGSTIVFAVGMTVVLIFLMLGYALRGSARDSAPGASRLTRVATYPVTCLGRASTYLRWVYLLLGAALVVPEAA